MPNYTAAVDVEFCEVCTLPMFINGRGLTDRTICIDCEDKLANELNHPCRKCGRRHTFQFFCGWCGANVCDGCLDAEHEGDDCHYPGDEE